VRCAADHAAAEERLPAVFRHVYASSTFLARLSIHAGTLLEARVGGFWPLADWWKDGSPRREGRALRERVLAHADEIARDLEVLRSWTPPDPPKPGTALGDRYAELAERYLECREGAAVHRAPPGPLEGARHPGFALAFDRKKRTLELSERRSPLLPSPLRLAVTLPLDPGQPLRFDRDALGLHQAGCAWDLFALRALLLALHDGTDEAVVALGQALGRPLWETLLDELAAQRARTAEARTWAFCLSPGYAGDFTLLVHARLTRQGGKAGSWRRQTFEALFGEETSPLEREIARVALSSLTRPAEARVDLASPQGHELARLLAQHPRVTLGAERKADPERDPRPEILVGQLLMRLERAPNGLLSPRFMVGDREMSPSLLSVSSGAFRGASRGAMLVSAFVPPALRPWLDMARRMGDALAFPPEAVSKLAMTTEPLVASGVAELPKSALGAELPYQPRPALRVDWRAEGAAVVELCVAVHPAAPLIAAGRGPALMTFEVEGRRVFVEREPDKELALVMAARETIAAPLLWDDDLGRTETLEEALALADYLERNPLGLIIEVKVGRAPTVVAWTDATRTLRVRREGAWLVLDGEIGAGGGKLTVGDVLDAVRLARQYVKAEDGTFLELSREAILRLRPIAIATELGQSSPDGAPRLHHAFGGVLAEASTMFERISGADLGEYARRFEQRGRAAKVSRLERGTLRRYQREGVAWMLRLAAWAPGCVLADDMGLGKTVQTASVLKTRAELGPALVIAPASVTSNWVSELARFMPSMTVRFYNEDRDATPSGLGPGDVLVVSYGLLQRHVDAFRAQRWATVVVDEAQYVKNAGAQRTDAVRALSRDFTIALTGTPLENHLGELFSITDLAFPGLLGTESVFRERFRRPIEGQNDTVRLEALGRLLAPFLLRRTRKAVLRELPPREEVTEYVELGPAEQRRYLALRRACEEQLRERKKGETQAQLKIAVLAALTRLRQLACDARLVDPSFSGGSAKIVRAVELVNGLTAEGHRALVFSQFTGFLEKVRDALEAEGLRVAYLAGDTPTTKRRDIVDAFQRGDFDVFCVSLLAGGTGLNLTRASYVIHLDPWWNPAAEEQAISRAHRMGQTAPVTVYRLVARGTIEEAVLDMQASKRDLALAVLDGKASTKAVTPADLLELLRFGA
jgi:superfamily II DNA or RNA helicase